MRVAFLGLGRMGAPMAAHAVRAGHELTVWNRTPGRAGDLVALGATEAASVADATRDAEVVVLMLFGPDAVRDVARQIEAPPGALVIDASTIGPEVARETAEALGRNGIRYVDAPVVGSVAPAREGALGVLVGGAPEDVEAALPLLRLWGDPARIRHAGPVGAGSAMKLVINLTLGIVMGGVGEALRLGHGLGLDRAGMLDVLAWGPVGFTVTQKRAMFERDGYRPANFSLALLAKDLDLCLASDAGLALTEQARDAAGRAVAAGHGDDDYAALAGWIAGAGR